MEKIEVSKKIDFKTSLKKLWTWNVKKKCNCEKKNYIIVGKKSTIIDN